MGYGEVYQEIKNVLGITMWQSELAQPVCFESSTRLEKKGGIASKQIPAH